MRTTAAIVCIFFLSLASTPAVAGQAVDRDIEKNIRQRLADVPVDWVKPSPIKGLYEIRSGSNIYYVDATGEHVIAGNIFDTGTKKNLTAARLEEINRVNWDSLPLNKAIISGNPKGVPIAIFTDPDCPYCRGLEKELRKIKSLKVYTFLYPLEGLHPNARAKAEAIWCAKDRHKALLGVMLHDQEAGKADCETPVADILALGSRLGIRGTPSIIAHDGRRISGLVPADRLEAWATAGK